MPEAQWATDGAAAQERYRALSTDDYDEPDPPPTLGECDRDEYEMDPRRNRRG